MYNNNWSLSSDIMRFLREANEADDPINTDEDPSDDMDLAELDLDSIDDTREIADADQLTVLKKRAGDLAEKWQDTFKQISELAKKLDLVATHDDKLAITIKKADGETSDYESDLDELSEIENSDDEIDDDFGPSEYDNRAQYLKDIPGVKQQKVTSWESENDNLQETLNKSQNGFKSDSPELILNENDVDDDF